MLRWPVTLALNAVFGAANGGAIAVPLRARFTVSTTVDSVSSARTLTSFNGRMANLTAPLTAISRLLPPPAPSTGSGAGASGSVVHSCDIRFAPVTPSTPAWCTFVITAMRPPAWASVPATFSITHISHSGRVRSNGSDAMWPQISASSLRPPGDGSPMRCRWRSTSKSLSSTHTGWSRLNRLSPSFSRNSGIALIRRARPSRSRSNV